MKIVLYWQPESTNHLYKVNCRWGFATVYMTKKWKKLKDSYIKQAILQKVWKIHEESLKIKATFFFKDRRKRDIDNYNKIWLDSLSGVIYKDDKQIMELELKKDYDKKIPRIELDILKI